MLKSSYGSGPATLPNKRKELIAMSENAIDMLVFLQLKDKDFSSSTLEEIFDCYKKTYDSTEQYLDSKKPNDWMYGQSRVNP